MTDEFEAEQSRAKVRLCGIGKLLEADTLDPERRAALEAALANPKYWHATIERVLAGWGFKVGASTIRRHRDEACCRG